MLCVCVVFRCCVQVFYLGVVFGSCLHVHVVFRCFIYNVGIVFGCCVYMLCSGIVFENESD